MKTKYKIIKAALGVATAAVAAVLLALSGSQTAVSQPATGNSLLTPLRLVGGGWVTNRIAGSTAFLLGTNNAARIDVTRSRYITVALQGNLVGAGTAAFTLAISRNVDGGTNREVCALLAATAAGTTPVYVTTNLDVGGYPFYYYEYLTNAHAGSSYLTNWIITANPK